MSATPAIDVDDFDEPYTRTANLMAVLQALAEAKAGDQHTGEMWWGIAEMTERALSDVRKMNAVFTQAADVIYREKRKRTYQPTRSKRPRRKKGAARKAAPQ